ncbi:MAG: type II toxin-antitoxin system HicA family toxin [Gammaproteobacteria bacterium]|nr:type II toxin-antitoxin system HicA family toxin [Gammaproteobacteria bacterium]
MPLNNRQRRTLRAVFALPVARNIAWRDIEALLIAAGAVMIEGRGSRVRFHIRGDAITLHRPHPRSEAAPYQVRDVREFLSRNGITP